MTDVPEPVPTSAVTGWTDEADVVVIGFGAAGAAAAIGALEAGADVLVLERTSGAGGTSAVAAGHFYLGGGTPVQQACGFEDTSEDMFRYLVAVSPDPDEERIRWYCDNSVAHFGWLEAQGIPFDRTYYPDKNVFQPTRECLIWSGNELVWPFREVAKPAPRGHKVAIEGDQGGALMMRVLGDRVQALGGRVAYDTGVVAIVIEEGRVAGVRTHRFGEDGHVRARRGVVIAAGGYAMDETMMATFAPAFGPPILPVGAPTDDGSGIRLGMSVGGAVRHMDEAMVSNTFYPPAILLKGIIVNREGRRFVPEDAYHGRSSRLVLDQPDRVAYLIVDSKTFAHPEFQTVPLIDGWESLAEMEGGLGLPEGSLRQTVADYNRHAATGQDPELQKHPDWLQPLDAPPYAAFDLSVGGATYVAFTVGGLATRVDGAVLTEDGRVVPGLYAAGASASTLAQDGYGYCSGISLGEGTMFGRHAGAAAAGGHG